MSKFNLGRVAVTCEVNAQMETDNVFATFVKTSLGRYVKCDWGDLSEEDKKSNDDALDDDSRIFAAYVYPKTNEKIWIITECDRSVTTILFPHEY